MFLIILFYLAFVVLFYFFNDDDDDDFWLCWVFIVAPASLVVACRLSSCRFCVLIVVKYM